MIFIYVTCPTPEEARRIARDLIDRNLIACANILPPHETIYRWDDKVEEGTETALILKTDEAMFTRVEAEILKIHSYKCPCIAAWPATDCHKPYADWIAGSLE